MARTSGKDKITLTLDFNVEKGKLQEVSNLLNKDVEKGFKGGKSLGYFNTLKTALTEVGKTANGIYSSLSKPLISKAQAKGLAGNLESAFKSLDSKLLSLQGNIGKTFNSIDNVAALKKIRQIGSELDELTADYQAASQLLSKSRNLGNKGALKSQLSAASKELDILNKKQGQLSTDEVKKQQELKVTIDNINKALAEKVRLQEEVTTLQAKHGVSSQAEFQAEISTKMNEQQGLIDGSMSVQDMETLRNLLDQIRKIIQDIMNTSQATGPMIDANINDITARQKEAEEQARTFKSVLKDLGIPLLTLNELASGMRQVIQYSYEYVKNLDKALTEISVVSGKTRSEVLTLTDTFIELSAKTGMAIDDIAQASTIFYQQGLDDAAVEKMTKYTALFAKISGEDVPTAADQLTAAINGFNFSVEEAGSVVDKMSVLAAYSAADIDELATAMSKGASQAAMAGLTFDEYNAYLATMIETTREAPENLGTSLKTIMSRFQNIKTGDNTEDDIDVNDVEKALKTVGVQLRDSEGQLRELGDVLAELGPKWSTLDRNTQAYIGTVVAGTRQQSRFVSLMQNWDRALELTAASENSAGAAAKMHASAMEGLEASLMNLTNAWQKLISNIVNGDSFKWLIDTLTGIVKWFGDGNTILKVFTVAITLLNAKTLMTNLSLIQTGKSMKNLDTITLSMVSQVKKLSTGMQLLKNPMSEESLEIVKQTNLIKGLIKAYEDLLTAKQKASGTYTGGDVPTTPATPAPVTSDGVKIDLPDKKTIDNTNKSMSGFKGKMSKMGTSIKTAAGNITNLVGSIQMGIMAATWALSIAETITDWLTTTSDEMKEKAEEAYNATQEEIDKRVELIESVKANADTYDRLSRKLNKSTEEVEQLAEAAEALAEAVPSSLVGYDSEGNPIINTNEARAAQEQREKELAEYAKEQMGNIGNLARADIREVAEKNVASNGNYDTTRAISQGGMAVGYGAAGTIAAIGVANGWNPVGWAALAVAGILAVGSTIAYACNEAGEEAAISAEELRLASKKANEVYEEYNQELLQNMSYITNTKIKDRTINGASQNARSTVAAYIGEEWLEGKSNDLYNKLVNKEITEEEYEEKYAELGNEWEKVLDKINDNLLASAYNGLNDIAENIGDKTYASVESAIEDIITNDMGISKDDELFTTLKEAFMAAAYSGFESGIYAVVKDLETRKTTDLQNSGYSEDSEKYKEIEAEYNKAIDNVKNKMTNSQVSFYDMLGLTDDVGLFNSVLDQYGTEIGNGLTQSTEAGAVRAIAILDSFKTQAEQKLMEIATMQGVDSIEEIDYDALTNEQKVEYDKWIRLAESSAASIEKAWNSMEISIDIPWKQLWEDFEKLTDRARTARETLAEMAEGEGVDASGWKEFTTMFDDIDLSAFDDTQLLQYANALDTIAGSLEVVDGQIYANGEAIKSIAELEEMAIQASIEATRQELLNKQLELEASKSIIDAQIATLEWKIAVAEGSADAEELKSQAEAAWLNASNKMNTFYIQNQGKVTEALVNQYANAFNAIATKYNQLQTAMSDGKIDQGEIDAINQSYKDLQKDLTLEGYSADLDEAGYNLDDLKNQLEAAKTASAQYQLQIDNIDLKLATLGSGLWSAENGVAGGDGSGKEKELDKYIGKLKEVYNIENRIALLEHRLSTLDTYSEIEEGDLYGKHLNQRIDLTNELLDQYEFLVSEEKKFANGYKDFIESSELGDVFDFDEFGQIIVDFEKYNALQDEAADGEKSLKEQADEMYETYTEMFEDLQDDFDSYISYLQKAIDLQQEIVDSYIEIETQAADAIKEIYEKMLDTKLEAIDREKEALEELREAREQARKDQDNAEAISDLQTNIQRTMMDSSGASDISFIKAQNDMNDKLEEIADDKYSEMLDNIIEKLEQEQDALQENFDELFDNLDWLHQAIEEDMMTNEERLLELFAQTDDWKQMTTAERKQQTDEWKTQMATYMETIQGGKSILDVCNYIDQLQQKTIQLDEALKTQVSNTGIQVANQIVSAIKSNGSGGGGGTGGTGSKSSYTSSPGTAVTANDGKSPDADASKYKNTDTPKDNYAFAIGDKVKSNVGALMDGYDYDKNGNLVKPVTNKGWDTNKLWTSGETMYVTKRDKYNGTNYYGLAFSKGATPILWANGHQIKYKDGGFANFTGPAWLDGTPQKPEAVLNALQTEHFIKFTNALDSMFNNGNMAGASSTVSIDTISFNVESMSSPEDGEAAFNMFVNKFKEIGSQSGIKIDSFKNRL